MTILYALEYVNREGDLEILHFDLKGCLLDSYKPTESSVDYEEPDLNTVFISRVNKSQNDDTMIWYQKMGKMAGFGDEDGDMTAYEFIERVTEDDEAFADFFKGVKQIIMDMERDQVSDEAV